MTGRMRTSRAQTKRAEKRSPVQVKRGPGGSERDAVDLDEALRRTADPLSRPRPEAILALQQTAGNSAVQRLIAQRAQRQHGREPKPGGQGSGSSQQARQAVSAGPQLAIQRQKKPAGAKEILPPDVMKELKAKIDQRVKQLPIPKVPSESEVKKAKSQGETQGKALEKVVKDKPAVAEFVAAEMTGGEGVKAPGGKTEAAKPEAPAAAGPAAGKSSAKAPKQPAKGKKKRTGFTGMRRRAKVAEGAGLTGEVVGWGEQAVETGFQFAEAAARPVTNVLGTVFSAIGLVFSAISAALDIRAIISSAKKVYDLKKVLSKWRAEVKGQFPSSEEQELLDAIEYAIEQKYFKIFKRAITLSSAVIGAGVAIAGLATGIALASNPVGWFILAGIGAVAAGIGLGVLFYKIGRAIYKWWKGTKGKVRGDMAEKLFDNALSGGGKLKGLAQDAIGALGLKWSKIEDKYKKVPDTRKPKVRKRAIGLIARKLASS